MSSLAAVLEEAGFTDGICARAGYLAVGCGGLVRELLTHTGGTSRFKDTSGQRVTVADLLVDDILREQLLRLVPGSGGYSEEGGHFGPQDAAVRWLVDPLDGTRQATLGGVYAVCVGAVIAPEGAPVAALGWVYVPGLAALYHASLSAREARCLLNGEPTTAEAVAAPEDLRRRYLAVSSNWQSAWLGNSAMKLSAPGATAVHLSQLVQPGSDVAAAALTRYRAHDVAAAVVVAAAGGCRIFGLDEGLPGNEIPVLEYLRRIYADPESDGPRVVVCTPGVAEALRAAS